MDLNILNLTKDTIVCEYGALKPGDVINNVTIDEVSLERVINSGLCVLTTEANIGLRGAQGIQGIQGPTPWKPIAAWAQNTNYTNAFPSDTVSYNGSGYVCLTPHNSGSTFDGTKWVLIAVGVAGAQGIQGIQGVKGATPWGTLTTWQSGQSYTNVAPASLVSYQSQTFVCVVSHTSTATFDSAKFMIVVAKGDQGIQGVAGPASWDVIRVWQSGQTYSNTVPVSIVTYLGATYACITTHTSTGTFDAAKFTVLASKGDQGIQGIQGNVGSTGAIPYAFPVVWTASTAYQSTVPASVVTYDNSTYICTVSHTSTSTFDVAKFRLLASRGRTILNGTVPPDNTMGGDGDFYIYDRTGSSQGRLMYGPKASGVWPGTGWNIQITGIADVPGLQGALDNKHNLNSAIIVNAGTAEKHAFEFIHTYNGTSSTAYQYVTANNIGIYDTVLGTIWNYDFATAAFTAGPFQVYTTQNLTPGNYALKNGTDLITITTPGGAASPPLTFNDSSGAAGTRIPFKSNGVLKWSMRVTSASFSLYNEAVGNTAINFSSAAGGLIELNYPIVASNTFTYGFAKDISSTDLNNLLTPGVYNGNTLANGPHGTADWFYIEVIYHSGSNWCTQRATSLTTKGIFYRTRFNITWGDWSRLTDNDVVLSGTVSSGTATFDARYTAKAVITNGGAHTWAFVWSATSAYQEYEIICTNAGAATITLPTIRWLKGDGTYSNTFSDQNVTLQNPGTNAFIFWTWDQGATVYGRAA